MCKQQPSDLDITSPRSALVEPKAKRANESARCVKAKGAASVPPKNLYSELTKLCEALADVTERANESWIPSFIFGSRLCRLRFAKTCRSEAAILPAEAACLSAVISMKLGAC